ncbi:MAG: hypothetical protein WC044_04825 [Crocinitomicaceae bacterium]
MEKILLNLGLSFTLSKLLPYLTMVVIGVLLLRWALRSNRIQNKIAKISIGVLLLLLPFGVYFALNPIYQGDFSTNGKKIMVLNSKTILMKDGLLVLAIPGCPYCFESIAALKEMKKHDPSLKIQFAVTGTEDKSTIEPYVKEADGKFKVVLMENTKALVGETGGKFPTFIMVNKGKAVYAWTNDQFGVRAKDRVENWD